MGNIRTGHSNYVKFILSVEGYRPLEIVEPENWAEDGFEFARHSDYHGIMTSFTNDLVFHGEAKDYIKSYYRSLGVNAKLNLIKQELFDVDGTIKFVTRYRALADFKTMNEDENGGLKLKFNSNDLAEILKSHENDKFGVERETSIDNLSLERFRKFSVRIDGRSLLLRGESDIKETTYSDISWLALPIDINGFRYVINNRYNLPLVRDGFFSITPITKIIGQGVPRHVSVDKPLGNVVNVPTTTGNNLTASNLFYVNSTDVNETVKDVRVEYDFQSVVALFDINRVDPNENLFAAVKIVRVLYDTDSADYSITEQRELDVFNGVAPAGSRITSDLNTSGVETFTVQQHEGLMLSVQFHGAIDITISKALLRVNEVAHFESSPNLAFAFYHDVWQRIIQILTGRNDAFYSKYFGRTELGYAQDGEGGLIGLMSGFWARAFDPQSEKYKSLTTSHKDLLESSDAVFNVGLGIEVVGFQERVRVEPIDYFYRERTVIKFEIPVKEKRKVIANDFFSGLEFGYRRGGDYEDEQGLDEPNTRTNYVTPIRVSEKKYTKLARYRSDEYGMERLRRKPQEKFPNEDTRGDQDIWLLDLKRATTPSEYEQKIWSDRLQELPTGVHSPETYKAMFFTPLRMMFRHAKNFMVGIEPYRDRLITYANGVANVVLRTLFIGESKAYQENQDIDIADLDRTLLLPEEVTFKYPYSTDIIDAITGSTLDVVSGTEEMVPNYYFKCEFTNKYGELERGYIKNVKVRDEIEVTLVLSNEEF